MRVEARKKLPHFAAIVFQILTPLGCYFSPLGSFARISLDVRFPPFWTCFSLSSVRIPAVETWESHALVVWRVWKVLGA